MSAPLYERLRAYAKQNRISYAMPGHKNGRGLKSDLLSLDVTELTLTENLHNPHEYVTRTQDLLSELYGSDKSYILTGGSTAGVQAMICGALKKGDTLLSACDCHMSVVNTCALMGINIRFFPKELDHVFAVMKGIDTVKEYLTEDIDAVIITSPTYYGLCSNIENIAKECHEKNIPLLVDEAHGAHFVSDTLFPETAVHFADAVCQSAHKTLNALNGAAYLHINGTRIDRERLEQSLSMLQSSSPSYPTAASADIARDEISGKNSWKATYEMCRDFKKKIADLGILTLQNDDMTRLVLNFSEFDVTGFRISDLLSYEGIDVEAADLFNVILIVTPSNTARDMRRLYRALRKIVLTLNKRDKAIKIQPPPITEKTLSPSRAFFADRQEIDFHDAIGHISCTAVTPYPPGVPVIHMGETIRAEQVEYIERLISDGAEVTGLSNNKIMTAVNINE